MSKNVNFSVGDRVVYKGKSDAFLHRGMLGRIKGLSCSSRYIDVLFDMYGATTFGVEKVDLEKVGRNNSYSVPSERYNQED